jgi:PIN domain nuclease of toxin-antitoxin system
MTEAVLDASALTALVRGEPGAGRVAAVLTRACISAVSLAEAYGQLVGRGKAPVETVRQIARLRLHVVPFDEAQAAITASLCEPDRFAGLSLGERSCLALAIHLSLPVLTAQQSWPEHDLPIKVTRLR